MKQVYDIIEDSIYYLDKKGLRLYFSSDFNRTRFKNLCDDYIKNENRKIINRYKVNIDLNQYMTLSLYKKIEKRGFRVLKIDENYYLKEMCVYNTTL